MITIITFGVIIHALYYFCTIRNLYEYKWRLLKSYNWIYMISWKLFCTPVPASNFVPNVPVVCSASPPKAATKVTVESHHEKRVFAWLKNEKQGLWDRLYKAFIFELEAQHGVKDTALLSLVLYTKNINYMLLKNNSISMTNANHFISFCNIKRVSFRMPVFFV